MLAGLGRSAARLCGASEALIWIREGDRARLAARHGPASGSLGIEQLVQVDSSWPGGEAIVSGRRVHVRDLSSTLARKRYADDSVRRAHGARRAVSVLAVPVLLGGRAAGVVAVARRRVAPFHAKEIALLEGLASHVALAIDHARLSGELEARTAALADALEQQNATGEILRVIASSPADVQPVFETIVHSATRLCAAKLSSLYRYDGRLVDFVVTSHPSAAILDIVHRQFPRPADASTLIGRAIAERAVINIGDMQSDPRANPQLGRAAARALEFRSMVIVPMFREEQPVGVITVGRAEPGGFSDQDVALLETFAAQAVIAIENARLFAEIEARNAELTDALERETATAEILRVMSASPTDVQPTFDAIAASATRLCRAANSLVIRFDGSLAHLAAHHNMTAERLAALERLYPQPPSRGTVTGRALLTRAVAHVADVTEDPEYALPAATMLGFRSGLAVPMLREGAPIGAILAARDEVAPFSAKQVALLRTFADQAVIAIENVRLFTGAGGAETAT